jgi:integrase
LPVVARQALETQRTRQRFARNAIGEAWQDRAGLVFTDAAGRPLRPEAVSREFTRARDRVGVPRVPFHALRHSTATTLLAQGVPLAVISEWLGHSGIAITAAAYAAIVPELRVAAADAMDRALGGAS